MILLKPKSWFFKIVSQNKIGEPCRFKNVFIIFNYSLYHQKKVIKNYVIKKKDVVLYEFS